MRPKPPIREGFLGRRSKLTIAIGARYTDGIIICADTKVVATDGATTSNTKMMFGIGPPNRRIVIADAGEDARAGMMVAEQIVTAIGRSKNWLDTEMRIKEVMTKWYNAYGAHHAPTLQFILGVTPSDGGSIYLCEPPATVLDCIPLAIGRGSRAVESLLESPGGLLPYSAPLRATLLRLAFLMYRAKKDEGSACGGDTHTLVMPEKGPVFPISNEEMAVAEKLAGEIDSLMLSAARNLTADLLAGDGSCSIDRLTSEYQGLLTRWHKMEFSSVKIHEWEKKKQEEKQKQEN